MTNFLKPLSGVRTSKRPGAHAHVYLLDDTASLHSSHLVSAVLPHSQLRLKSWRWKIALSRADSSPSLLEFCWHSCTPPQGFLLEHNIKEYEPHGCLHLCISK